MSEFYMLDTDTCAFILRRTSDTLLARIQVVPVAQQVMSVVTCAELQYGIQVSSKKKANLAAVDAWPATLQSWRGRKRRPDTMRRFEPI